MEAGTRGDNVAKMVAVLVGNGWVAAGEWHSVVTVPMAVGEDSMVAAVVDSLVARCRWLAHWWLVLSSAAGQSSGCASPRQRRGGLEDVTTISHNNHCPTPVVVQALHLRVEAPSPAATIAASKVANEAVADHEGLLDFNRYTIELEEHPLFFDEFGGRRSGQKCNSATPNTGARLKTQAYKTAGEFRSMSLGSEILEMEMDRSENRETRSENPETISENRGREEETLTFVHRQQFAVSDAGNGRCWRRCFVGDGELE
ncbi:hypothetical protein Dimus_037144 [Dionaea muscipula]